MAMTAIARFCIGVLLVTSKPAQWLSEIIDLFSKAIPILVTVVGVGAVRIRSPKGAADLPAFIGPKIPRKWLAPGSLLRCFERTALA